MERRHGHDGSGCTGDRKWQDAQRFDDDIPASIRINTIDLQCVSADGIYAHWNGCRPDRPEAELWAVVARAQKEDTDSIAFLRNLGIAGNADDRVANSAVEVDRDRVAS